MSRSADGDDNVVELEFRITDPGFPFVAASLAEGCRLVLEDVVPRSDGQFVEYYSIEDGSVERLAERTAAVEDVEATIVSDHGEDGGLMKFRIDRQCVVVTLADHGAVPQRIVAEDGTGTVVAEVPSSEDASAVIAAFRRHHPAAQLVARRERDRDVPLFTTRELQQAVDDRLTKRQHEVLLTAYLQGYFEWPREHDGEEISEMLGVSGPTFSEHLRTAIMHLLSVYFGDRDAADERREG